MKSSNQNDASSPATGADHHRAPGDFMASSNQYERGSALSLASSSRDSFKGMASCKLDLGPVSSAKVSLVSFEEQCINQYDKSAAIAQAPQRESDAELSCRYLNPTSRRISPTVSVPTQRHDEVKTRVGGNPHSKAPSRRIAPIRCSYINKYGVEDVKSCLRSQYARSHTSSDELLLSIRGEKYMQALPSSPLERIEDDVTMWKEEIPRNVPSRGLTSIRASHLQRNGLEDAMASLLRPQICRSHSSICGPKIGRGASSEQINSKTASNSNRDEKAPLPNRHTKEKHEAWVCSACSFVNENPLHLTCSICATTRPH
jgi:hypothetical protein